MKKIYLVGIITIFIMISCSYKPGYKFYDPHIGNNYVSSQIMSNMKLVTPPKNNWLTKSFGFVIVRKCDIEKEMENHLLLCPILNRLDGKPILIKNLLFYKSVYFNRIKLLEFIKLLEQIIEEWDKDIRGDEGKFYNFVIHEKVDIIRSMELDNTDNNNKLNIQTKYGYEFSATYQKYKVFDSYGKLNKTSNGLFIDGRNFPLLTIEKKETVKSLLDVLEICLDELPEKNIPEDKDKVETEKSKIRNTN